MGRPKSTKPESIDSNSSTKKTFRIDKDMIYSDIRLSEKQNELYKTIRNNTLTICHGASGTSKTYTSCYTALKLLVDDKVDKIIITKPLQTSGEDVGFLKGGLTEKIDPYLKSYFSTFEKIIGKQNLDILISNGIIVVEILAFMRGSTFDNCVMLLDESQNSSVSQLMLWITRLGKNSKAVMMGDTSQYDVKAKDSGFNDFIEMTDGMDGLKIFKFSNTDIVRNKFLVEITNRYDKYRNLKK